MWKSFTYNIFFDGEGRAESSAKEKEREDKVRRIREQQEDERKKKLEELKQHVSFSSSAKSSFYLVPF